MPPMGQVLNTTKQFLKEHGYDFAKVLGTVTDDDTIIAVVDTSVILGIRKLGHFIYDKEGLMLTYELKG